MGSSMRWVNILLICFFSPRFRRKIIFSCLNVSYRQDSKQQELVFIAQSTEQSVLLTFAIMPMKLVSPLPAFSAPKVIPVLAIFS